MMKESTTESPAERLFLGLSRQYQAALDKTVVHIKTRWAALFFLLIAYYVRVWYSQSHYIVTYGLHIFLLNLLIGFLSPAIDPESGDLDGPVLPTSNEEFRPFSRRLPEMKMWHSSMRAVLMSLLMTFFSFFDIPVFWPILLIYFIILFVLTMRRQIAHMIKHRYVPCSWGKKRYTKKEALAIP